MKDLYLKNGWRFQDANRKLRYVYILDKFDRKLIKKIEKMKLDYPKRNNRVNSLIGRTFAHQARDGGSNPTLTLQ